MEAAVIEQDIPFELMSDSISDIKEIYACHTCGKCFDKKSKLYNHNKIHSNKKYTCNICFRAFSIKAYLDSHRQTHGPKRNLFKCSVCYKGFAFKKYLTTHSKIHASEKMYKCDMCSKTFTTRSYLCHHKRTHSNEKLFVCTVCSKPFLLREYLVRHMEIHSSGKTKSYVIQSETREDGQILSSHENLQTSYITEQVDFTEDKFMCNLCHKAFSTKRYLMKHIKIHSRKDIMISCSQEKQTLNDPSQPEEKPSICILCSKVFTCQWNLKRHIVNMHSINETGTENLPSGEIETPGILTIQQENMKSNFSNQPMSFEMQFICPICNKAFSNRWNLKKHLKNLHLNSNNNSHYSETTKEAISEILEAKKIRNSKKKKSYQCQKCSKIFSSSTKLNDHIKLQRCPFGFTCALCNQSFKRDYSLDFHLKEHYATNSESLDLQKIQMENVDLNQLDECEKESEESEKFECQICFETFISKCSLTCHMAYHTMNKTFHCDLCSKSFLVARALHSHKRAHLSNITYKCGICNESFTNKSFLNNHMRIHIYEKTYSCEQCELVFCTENALENHRIHHNEIKNKHPERFICEKCGIAFKNLLLLSTHLENNEHVGVPCDVCDRYLSNEYSLKRHMKTHAGDNSISRRTGRLKSSLQSSGSLKRFEQNELKCSSCGLTFENSFLLQKHKKNHTSLSCKICDMRFARKTTLIRHLKTHTGERPFKCNICSKTFSQSYNLLIHKTLHSKEKPFVCSVCSSTFKRKRYLEIHEKKHYTTPLIKCEFCSKTYTDDSSLRKHKKNTGCGKFQKII